MKTTSKIKRTPKMKMTSKIIIWRRTQRMMPLIPLKFTNCILVMPMGTIPGRFGSVWVGSGGVGPVVIIRLSKPASRARALAWLSLATRTRILIITETTTTTLQQYNLKIMGI